MCKELLRNKNIKNFQNKFSQHVVFSVNRASMHHHQRVQLLFENHSNNLVVSRKYIQFILFNLAIGKKKSRGLEGFVGFFQTTPTFLIF